MPCPMHDRRPSIVITDMPRPPLGHVAEETRLAIPPDTEVPDVGAVGEPGYFRISVNIDDRRRPS